jgi:hypothetical protein
MSATVPTSKRVAILATLQDCLQRKSVTKREALSIIGKLNYLCRVVRSGRPYLAASIKAANGPKKLSHYVYISSAVKEDIRWWTVFLERFSGTVPLPRPLPESATGENTIETDASDLGFGGRLKNAWFSFPVNSEQSTWSINIKELYALATAVLTWCGQLRASTIVLLCDNEAVVKVVDKGRSKHATLNAMVRQVYQVAALNGMQLLACHVPGQRNSAADALSRLNVTEFRRLVPTADTEMTCISRPFLVL